MTQDESRLATVASACRACRHDPLVEVIDLGRHPEANTLPARGSDAEQEPRWPLRLLVCERCWLVQLDDASPPEAVTPGPRPYELSETMRSHAESFVDDVLARLGASPEGLRVIEVASHGAYLQPFLAARGVRSVILEASPVLAEWAGADGYSVVSRPLDVDGVAALEGEGRADVLIDNYLLAHVGDPDGFAAGVRAVLEPGGTAVLEFAYLPAMLRDGAFDSIRHGHFSYFSLTSLATLLEKHGLAVFDVAPQPVYGGSLRVFASHAGAGRPVSPAVREMLAEERRAGVCELETYRQFAGDVERIRAELVAFLERIRQDGRVAVGYGAPSRASTLLNFCGITTDLLRFTVDRSPLKQGRLVPGCGIPVEAPDEIGRVKPAYVVILTWDIEAEVRRQLRDVEAWGGRFVVPLPRPALLGAA